MKVAVYGTLRQHCGNDGLLRGSPMEGIYEVRHHQMYTENYGFPYVHYSPTSSIVVEVYEVDDDTMLNLDALEGYPVHYQRKMIPYYDNSNGTSAVGTAWMYYVTTAPSKAGHIIKSGDWTTFISDRNHDRRRII